MLQIEVEIIKNHRKNEILKISHEKIWNAKKKEISVFFSFRGKGECFAPTLA